MKLQAQYQLTSEMTVAEGARIIFGHLMAVMRHNEAGIQEDQDIECLHDFRVAVRRSRSLLTMLKRDLDPAFLPDLRKGLQVLGQATNALRDLDVYMAQRPHYEKMLPAVLRPAIAPWFEALGRRREREAISVKRFLTSRTYGRIMDDLARFAAGEVGTGSTPNAYTRPLIEVARKAIDRSFARSLRIGRRISAASPDDLLHRLRIQSKQLRYALEFFRDLFPPGPAGVAIRQVKALQECLGIYNDRSVQQQFLFDYLKGIPAPYGPRRIALAAAIGALIGLLFLEKVRQRKGFEEVFARFSDPVQVRRFRKLFAQDGS